MTGSFTFAPAISNQVDNRNYGSPIDCVICSLHSLAGFPVPDVQNFLAVKPKKLAPYPGDVPYFQRNDLLLLKHELLHIVVINF